MWRILTLAFVAVVVSADDDPCDIACTAEYAPVCGSDGRTYASLCSMESYACSQGITLEVANQGACEVAVQRPELNQECVRACPLNFAPVCASNGQTYPNECAMETSACVQGITLEVASQGACEEAVQRPELNQECVRACPLNFAPVCASNGQTYPNECAMETSACVLDTELRVVAQGACPTPRIGRCIQRCPRIYRPVCGSDGKTYSNICVMRVQACLMNQELTVASEGRCDE